MKAFEIETYGQKDIVVAHSVLKAIKFYIEVNGCNLFDIDVVSEIANEKWDFIVIDNAITLSDLMCDIKAPAIIATNIKPIYN